MAWLCEACRRPMIRSKLDSTFFAYRISSMDLKYLQDENQIPQMENLIGNLRNKKRVLREKLVEYYQKVTVSKCGFMFHHSCMTDKLKLARDTCPKCSADILEHLRPACPLPSEDPLFDRADSVCTLIKKYCIFKFFDVISPVMDTLTWKRVFQLIGFFLFLLLSYFILLVVTSPAPMKRRIREIRFGF